MIQPPARSMFPLFAAVGMLGASPSVAADSTLDLCPAALEKGNILTSDDWLLTPADFQTAYRLPESAKPRIEQMLVALKARGVTVAMTVVPTRGVGSPNADAVAASHGLNYTEAQAREVYQQLLSWFEARGVITVDLATAFQEYTGDEPMFYARDHHWTQAAAELTAQQLAAAVSPRFPDLAPASYTIELKKPEPRSWPGSRTTRMGQLCPDFEAPELTHPVYEAVRQDPPTLGLLDDQPAPEVVLVGTSNSSPDFTFPGYLQRELSTEVLVNYLGGAGPLTTLMEYLRSDAFIDAPPRLLIWEWNTAGCWVRREEAPEFVKETAWNQIIPSIWGPCDDPVLTGTTTVKAGENTLIQAQPGAAAPSGDLYLHLGVSSPSLVAFEVIARQQGGVEQRIEVPYFGRLRYSGHVFLQLPTMASAIEELVLVAPEGVNADVNAQLCRVPAR